LTALASVPIALLLAAGSPFGVARAGGSVRAADVAALSRELGLATVEWNADLRQTHGDPDLEVLAAAGLRLVLSVDPRQVPAAELGSSVGRLIDAWSPALVVVGGPEHPRLFRDSGPDAYLASVRVACAVARQRRVSCTSGGLAPEELLLLVFHHYRSTGRTDAARAFAERTLPEQAARLWSPVGGERLEESLARGGALLRGYRGAGLDYVNLRWTSDDAVAFGEAARVLREATGLPVVSTALGGPGAAPAGVPALLEEVQRLKIAVALWPAADLGTRAPDGAPHTGGDAFRQFTRRLRIRAGGD
jgi:hypothetical protein